MFTVLTWRIRCLRVQIQASVQNLVEKPGPENFEFWSSTLGSLQWMGKLLILTACVKPVICSSFLVFNTIF